MKYSVIILAAGSGIRTGLEYNKVFHKIKGKKVVDYSLEFFRKHDQCKEIILVCSEKDFNYVYDNYNQTVDYVILGGSSRQESVFKGLNKANNDYVLIHDSARPFINEKAINDLLIDLAATSATTLAVFMKDTIVKTNGNRLGKTLDRNKVLRIQTPQAFKLDLILEAHQKARNVGYLATDDTDLISRFTDVMPSFVLGDYRSFKLTNKSDIDYLEVIL